MKISFDIEELKQFYLSLSTDRDEWYDKKRGCYTTNFAFVMSKHTSNNE